jgi:phosphopentomutase
MTRAILIVMDSFGIGNAPDAADYGDEGSDTLGHIADFCMGPSSDRESGLWLPNLASLGLGAAYTCSTGKSLDLGAAPETGCWAVGRERSKGKDTTVGHWELTGVPVSLPFHVFKQMHDSFPADLVRQITDQTGLSNILGNCHASGTNIINEYGAEHLQTRTPIFYTSADSVIQIAAHEAVISIERLYEICKSVRTIVDPLNVGRVIARPFVGNVESGFKRTKNRKDFSIPPRGNTILDFAKGEGCQVVGLGKISDIFAGRGITDSYTAADNMALFDVMLSVTKSLESNSLMFANFVDFDSEFGHQRDPLGYASALESFDTRLPEFLSLLDPEDLVIFTADHGNDPTWHGSDHTREQVPILVKYGDRSGTAIGLRDMADVGATIADYLGISLPQHGCSFLPAVRSS